MTDPDWQGQIVRAYETFGLWDRVKGVIKNPEFEKKIKRGKHTGRFEDKPDAFLPEPDVRADIDLDFDESGDALDIDRSPAEQAALTAQNLAVAEEAGAAIERVAARRGLTAMAGAKAGVKPPQRVLWADPDAEGTVASMHAALYDFDRSNAAIGRMARHYAGDTAWHTSFGLDPGYQGDRIGAEMLEELEKVYRKHGLKRIRTIANDDVGGYAWAKLGFDFWDPMESWLISNKMLDSLEGKRLRGKPDEKAEADMARLIKRKNEGGPYPTAIELAMVGHPGGEPKTWFGKEAMLRSTWSGYKNIEPEESRADRDLFDEEGDALDIGEALPEWPKIPTGRYSMDETKRVREEGVETAFARFGKNPIGSDRKRYAIPQSEQEEEQEYWSQIAAEKDPGRAVTGEPGGGELARKMESFMGDSGGRGDFRTASMLSALGADGQPLLLSPGDFVNYEGEKVPFQLDYPKYGGSGKWPVVPPPSVKRDEFWRGVRGREGGPTAKDILRRTALDKPGKSHVGRGVYGRGIYIGDRPTAEIGAKREYGTDPSKVAKDGAVERFKLKPGTRLIDWHDIPMDVKNLPDEWLAAWVLQHGYHGINGALNDDPQGGINVMDRSRLVMMDPRPKKKPR